MSDAHKADVVDMLRKIEIDCWADIENKSGWKYGTNLGVLTHQAAEELAALRARVAELEEAIVNYINDDSTRRDLRHEVEHLLP